MISLKLTPEEAKGETLLAEPEPGDAPAYPCGTTLYLDDDTLLKLGISELPPVGTKFTLTAIVEVTGNNARENQEGRESSLDLQITDMELGAAQTNDADRAKRIYDADL